MNNIKNKACFSQPFMNYNTNPQQNYPSLPNQYNPYQPLLPQNPQPNPPARKYPAVPNPPYNVPQHQQRPLYPQLNPVAPQSNPQTANRYPSLPVPPTGPEHANQVPKNNMNYAPNQTLLSAYNPSFLNEEAALIASQVDMELTSGKFRCYKIWLYVMFVISFKLNGLAIYGFVSHMPAGYFYLTFGLTFIAILYCLLGLKALHEKSLEEANKAVWFMKGFTLGLVGLIITCICYMRYSMYYYIGRQIAGYCLAGSVIGFFIHVFVILSGAKKVRALLKKKEDALGRNPIA